MISFALSAAIVPFLFGTAEAFWRVQCSIIQKGRIDPLVNPGALAAHSHTIIGGSNIGINSTFQSMVNSECTSCEITADKSAYWTPTLYYNFPNGSFLEVGHNGGVAYYLGRGPNKDATVPFPKGLNILSGKQSARSYDNTTMTWGNATYPPRPVADRVSFACLDTDAITEKNWMHRTECANGLRAQIHFQSCWNGKDLYRADNSHVAYQSQIDNGICPPSHPIQIPHLFLETLYQVKEVPTVPGGRYVFAQGDPTGYGFHGDFFNGWEPAIQAAAVRDCLSTDATANGVIGDCPILQSVYSDGYSKNCPERPPQVGEVVSGMLSKLPGCITVTPGPADAPSASNVCGPNVPKPSITSTKDSVPLATRVPAIGSSYGISLSQKYLGCFNDSGLGVRALNSVQTANYTVMTVAYCQKYCADRGYRLSGVEFSSECHCDNYINPTSKGGSDACTWNCGGTMTTGGVQEICGGTSYISIYNNTDPSFNANGSLVNSAGGVAVQLPLVPFASNYLGCATDSKGSTQALNSKTSQETAMTIEKCATFCEGFQFYGLEYSSQCFCGNALNSPNFITTATSSPSNSTCNMRCGGRGDQLCGGPNAISLYKNTAYVAPKIKSPIGKYVTKGCITDPGGVNRPLTGPTTSSDTMTADVCVKFCLGKRMHYAGVEYGRECYCGNGLKLTGGAKSQTCGPENLMVCAGNKLQYCGAGNLMNLYYSAIF